MNWGLSRRRLLAGLSGSMALLGGGSFGQIIEDISQMRPGDFTWHPERSTDGGVAVVVSIPEQRVHIYRAGIRIAVSTCSTGREGHETPTGVFTILQKDRDHRSSTYNNAPMPNMNRLTWDGIALHAGNLPGYPASHGCVRLPYDFSALLFGVTHVGTPVIIAGSASDPWEVVHPGLLLAGTAEGELAGAIRALDDAHHPSDWTEQDGNAVVALLASSADRAIYLFREGEEIARASVDILGGDRFGEHVLMLERGDDGLYWVGVTHSPDPSQPSLPEASVADRLRVPDDFNRVLAGNLHLGMTFALTDLPSHPDRRSGADFVIMTS